MMRVRILVCLAWVAAAPAAAQPLPLPELPVVGGVLERLPGTDAVADADDLRQARGLRVRALLRAHRRQLEADPAGEPIVRGRIIALDMSNESIARARAQGFEVARRDGLDAAGELTTLRTPPRLSTRRALQRLRQLDPDGVYDFDHIHLESAGGEVQARAPPSSSGNGPRIGLVDGGVGDAWSDAVAAQRGFAGDAAVASAHGRAVAALLLASTPDARLYVADIYGGAPAGGASSALSRALAWLAHERTPVINISLVGPRNRVVEALVARLVARGHIVVAAVGNDGPAAAPLYPAAYPGVVGVTGVDRRGRALVEAGRGPQVDFAALGVIDLEGARLRGTSYAAPVVAGALAPRVAAPDAARAEAALGQLRQRARDLGAQGRDDVFGYGLIEAAPGLASR